MYVIIHFTDEEMPEKLGDSLQVTQVSCTVSIRNLVL